MRPLTFGLFVLLLGVPPHRRADSSPGIVKGLQPSALFEQNEGQADARFQFLRRAGDTVTLLSATGAEFQNARERLRVDFAGAAPSAVAEGLERQAAVVNYILGSDRSQWQIGVPCYSRVRYRDVYPGIDIIYYVAGPQVEFDFEVRPGADPRQIRLSFSGNEPAHLLPEGGLAAGPVRFRAPRAYQAAGEVRQAVAGRYRLDADGAVGLELGEYDHNRPLTIDPIIDFYVAPNSSALALRVDAAGNIYVAGVATQFIRTGTLTTKTIGKCVVTKLNAEGQLVYTTYLGGTDYYDALADAAVDGAGNLYFTGLNNSPDFPRTNTAVPTFYNGMITKLSPTGSLIYSYILPGAEGSAIQVDTQGQAYVAGTVIRPAAPLPATAGTAQTAFGGGQSDGFFLKLNAEGTAPLFAIYLGSDGDDTIDDLSIDASGAAYLLGRTNSASYPIGNPLSLPRSSALPPAGNSDAFLLRLAPGASGLISSTLLPPMAGLKMAVDSQGAIYVTGYTDSKLVPVTKGAFQDVPRGKNDIALLKFEPGGSKLAYATYFGSSGNDGSLRPAVDSRGNLVFAGSSELPATDLPYTPGFPKVDAGGRGFIAGLNASGSGLLFSSGVGALGSGGLGPVAFDAQGRIYVAGQAITPLGVESAQMPEGFRSNAVMVYRIDPPAGIPATLSLVSGDNQVSAYGQVLPEPLVAAVMDASGAGVAEVTVIFQAPGSRVTAHTDTQGRAAARVGTAGATGKVSITATVGGLPAIAYAATVRNPPSIAIPAGASPGSPVAYRISTVAGGPQLPRIANMDLFQPSGIATDAVGNLYVGQAKGHNVLKIAPSGDVHVLAGTGEDGSGGGDGLPAAYTSWGYAGGVALDALGNAYVGDGSIRKISASTGIVTTLASGAFEGLCAYPDGNLLATTRFNPNRFPPANTIARISPTGAVTVVAGTGVGSSTGDGGPATAATLNQPLQVVCDPKGDVYVSESGSHQVRRIDKAGVIQTLAAFDGGFPGALALDAGGSLYVGVIYLTGDNAVVKLSSDGKKVASFPLPSRVVKSEYNGRSGIIKTQPYSAVVDANGILYFTVLANGLFYDDDQYHGRIMGNPLGHVYSLDPSSGKVQAVDGTESPAGNTAASLALSIPRGVAVDNAANLYIADWGTRLIYQVEPSGKFRAVAGFSDQYFRTGLQNFLLEAPISMATDSGGQLHFAGGGGLWRRTAAGQIQEELVPPDTLPLIVYGGFGAAYSLQISPSWQVHLGIGNTISRLTADSALQTVAGRGFGFSGDGGPAFSAALTVARGVASDRNGSLYFADWANHRVRKIDRAGVISTVAGNGAQGYSGDGGLATRAQLGAPMGVAVDSSGNLLIADSGNARVRVVAPGGIITTVAGSGAAGYSGDGGPATQARLNFPTSIAVDSSDGVYVADTYNRVIRKLTPDPSLVRRTQPVPNAASYTGGSIAPDEFVALFGSDFNTQSSVASANPFPASLAGTTVRIRDSRGVERAAGIYAVAPSQVNFVAPPDIADGEATLTLTTPEGAQSSIKVPIERVAPGVFTANFNGTGPPAATIEKAFPDGGRSSEPAFQCGATAGSCVAREVDLVGADVDSVLVLYGTGVRYRSSLAAVVATIGTQPTDVLYAGPQGGQGLDQINVRIPYALKGRGTVAVRLTVDGKPANPVNIRVK